MSEVKRWMPVGFAAVLAVVAIAIIRLQEPTPASGAEVKTDSLASSPTPAPEASDTVLNPRSSSAPSAEPIESWNERVHRLGPQARQAIERFSIEYPGLLAEFNPDQMAWAIQAGIPTPEEFAAAESMSLEALEARAASGDSVAAVFAADRRLDGLASKIGDNGMKGLAGQTREALATLPAAQRWMDQLNYSSCSIFAPHYELRVMRVLYGQPTSGMELAALSRVAAMGDWRVEPRIVELMTEQGITGTNVHEIRASLRNVAQVASRRGTGCAVPRSMPQ